MQDRNPKMDSETGEKSGESVMPEDPIDVMEESSKSKEKTQVSADNATGQVDAMEEDIEILDEKEVEVQSLWCQLVPKTDKYPNYPTTAHHILKM